MNTSTTCHYSLLLKKPTVTWDVMLKLTALILKILPTVSLFIFVLTSTRVPCSEQTPLDCLLEQLVLSVTSQGKWAFKDLLRVGARIGDTNLLVVYTADGLASAHL